MLVTIIIAASVSATQTFPARLFNDGRDIDVVVAYVGHEKHQMTFIPTWHAGYNDTTAALLLPRTTSSVYDAQRVLLAVRDEPSYWSAVVRADVSAPLFHFGPTSDVWLKFARLTWTGVEYQLERVASSRAALPTSPAFLRAGTGLSLAVERTTMAPLNNVTLVIDLDREQSLFPPTALAAWLAQPNATLLFDGPSRYVILDCDDPRDDGLVAPNIHAPAVVVIGRRLLRRIAQQWWANASGVQVVRLAHARAEASATSYVLAGAVLILFYLMAYWTVVLADDLMNGVKPSRNEHQRVFRHILILGFVGLLTHIVGPWQVSNGGAVDVAIAEAVHTYSIVHVVVSAAVALLGVLVLALAAGEPSSAVTDWSAIYVLYSILIARSILAGLLPVGARSALGAVVLLAALVLLNIMPAIYMVFQLSRVRPTPKNRLVSFLVFLLVVGSNVASLALLLGPAILGALNAHVSSLAVETGVLVLTGLACVLPLYVGVLSPSE